ncbi:NfeD family protein [Spiribacter halobius]|uniref:NfeD family protein n=1 Tax=Sediminicurvatus halobius TaxID=2182432 RepID=UPI001E528127|nr:nodulation protein NfeD [Spiribacter halobius]UEX76880.1 nodulation protein NfeD [Spiribacter halobius]
MVHQLTIDGAIGPVTANYVSDGLEEAAAADAEAVILRMDTPGGLDSAMRQIVRDILASPVPVIGYVAPSGARAASAGTYILYASHVAAMAPGTNLGAATPVRIGGMPGTPGGDQPGGDQPGGDQPAGEGEGDGSAGSGEGSGAGESGGDGEAAEDSQGGADEGADQGGSAMERKMINDAVAYIRSLAELRGRNAEWAERAVRESVSLSYSAALEQDVIDLVAPDSAALLAAADGREVSIGGESRSLALAGATVEDRPPDWRTELLSVITNPNVAYILMLVGIYGLIFELANPGSLVPGVLGGICLLLALFAFQALPVNYAGLGLILLGILFMIAEALVPSFGALGVGGVIAFAFGSVLLFDAEGEGFQLSMMLVGGVTAASLVLFLGTALLAARAFQRRGVAGAEHMLGGEGEVLQAGPPLRVRIEGESWLADSDAALAPGDIVRVVDMQGLRLKVEPVAKTDTHTQTPQRE